VARALTVQLQLVQAEAGGIDAGGDNAALCAKVAAKQRNRL
jgi:hypothetical protein